MPQKGETGIQGRIRVAVAGLCTLFRNNVGLFETKDGRKVRTGLIKGSSDLVGWTEVEVTAEMVGGTVAVFTGLEVKSATGRLTKPQRTFSANVRAAGGICATARSEGEAKGEIMRQVKKIQGGRGYDG